MTWFKVDDGLPHHTKLEALESEPMVHAVSVAAWTLMGADCSGRRTDGHFSEHRLRKVLAHWTDEMIHQAMDALLRIGMWERTESGFIFHDWADYQPTKAELDADRKSSTERQKRWREKQRAARKAADLASAGVDASTNAVTHGVTHGVTNAETNAETNGATNGGTNASAKRVAVDGAPSRPVPSRSLTTFVSDTQDGPIVGGIDPESVRLAYVKRWEQHAPGKRLPMVARGFGAPVWVELAHEFVDAETTEFVLDRAFVDPFVTSTGWTPQAIRGAAQRLSVAESTSSVAGKASDSVTGGNGGPGAKKSILEALRARHDEALLAAEKCALRGDADGKARHTAEAARLRAEWKRERSAQDQAVAS